eukprot:CAMPEP_0172544784 /NCGR_PEP_ID=MMETSP1067-20121228/14861_1 /TAXON_ID=265564 ORGANISM="Thalassiosira punctigera, Strain Tpunct2005C2" /NCGR_SAMPLE_ID=MMETSP1067 /ASSEMBLY_ACC=CAM_ASM_000444 /LENGTH=226 /DNA_ID=CAMNT_0013331405 /DNA_START=87 /DNA_END=767 /DNA_ORIENTATION=-
MKRMGRPAPANESAVALGRDMLKRPSQKFTKNAFDFKNANSGKGVTSSASMSAFGGSLSTAATRPGRSRGKLATMTLKESFALSLKDSPDEVARRMTDQIASALGRNADSGRGANETFSPKAAGPMVCTPIDRSGRKKKGPRSHSLNNADIPAWKGYRPKSSSRRNSPSSLEMAASMKLNAQLLLEGLGNIADEDGEDDDEDDDLLNLGLLDVLGEEGFEQANFDD